jgi:hypothetical protein
MKNNMNLFSILIILCSCTQESNLETPEDFSYKGSGEYYFDFDEIDHYSFNLGVNDIKNKAIITPSTRRVLYNDIKAINDTMFIDSLILNTFSICEVNPSFFKSIKEISKDKNHDEIMTTDCIPIYRDILVFKRHKTIIGVAKICLECSMHSITGTTINTIGFGQSGDYEKLKLILDKTSKSGRSSTKHIRQ